MKNLLLTSVMLLFLATTYYGQTPPETTTSAEAKTSSYSITFDSDGKKTNSSVSIKRNANFYKFRGRFHKSKTTNIKEFLMDKLRESTFSIDGDTYNWEKIKNGEKVYNCKLTKGNIRLYLDKETASLAEVALMDKLGATLKDAISGSDAKKESEKYAERELKNAERELKRAQQALENVKRRNAN